MDRQHHDVILVGASAGGVDALMRLCSGLPRDLPAAVLVVLHMPPAGPSLLPQLLNRAGPLPAAAAEEGEPIRHGRIYVARPDLHLLVDRDGSRLLLRHGPQENRSRPAIDPLFRSAALAFGPRAIGVVLSGLLDDGTAGLVAIKACGGLSVVQDPEDAAWPDMPLNALRGDSPDHSATLADLPALLDRLARSPAGPPRAGLPQLSAEVSIAEQEEAVSDPALQAPLGTPSRISCPQCGGVLNEIEEGRLPRFRCQIGHAYGPESLLASQAEALEAALGVAIRTHNERRLLFRRMEAAALGRKLPHAAARWARAAEEAARAARLITRAAEAIRRLPGEEPKPGDG
ncbi:chemotaxis protein CheB [Belnapia sp. T6]|uniref:protein-glutamate methylesterase n=1 Tax=Belnapia mucosa TaxID=2804532 RepID=A0ABS1V9Y5_9PROT|nr:chemotaxis protein CheB [Belnapia mucosa]MBL6458457.1 chemotaxis protein CheB [Belnapia mucosa]